MGRKPGVHVHDIQINRTKPMKHRSVLMLMVIALLLSGCSTGGGGKQKAGAARDEAPSLVVDKSTYIVQPRLYDHSWDWLAKAFPGDSRQVQSADRKDGKIVATGTRDINIAYQQTRPVRFRIRIDARVGFYTLALDQPEVKLEGRWYPVNGARKDVLGPQIDRLFNELAANYGDYLAPFDKQQYPSDPDLELK
jgi:hypothetical protein